MTEPETVKEARKRLALEHAGTAYMRWRTPDGQWQLLPLPSTGGRVAIGRAVECDVRIPWDPRVSRVHALVERVGTDWVLSDDGLSRNGTWVAGARIATRVRLAPGTQVCCGDTVIRFHDPAANGDVDAPTQNGASMATSHMLTPMQRSVLVELCRPVSETGPFAAPAPNQAIADALHISVQTVKSHLRVLFTIFGLGALPQNQKRAKLVESAVALGMVAVAAGD